MQNFWTKELSEQETDEIFKRLKESCSEEFLQRFFVDAFQDEKKATTDGMEYKALTKNERSYYLVYRNANPEVLFGINFHYWKISSIGKIIVKSVDAWQHLKALLEEVLVPKCRENGIMEIGAKINPECERVFEDLDKNSNSANDYRVVLPEPRDGTVRIHIKEK